GHVGEQIVQSNRALEILAERLLHGDAASRRQTRLGERADCARELRRWKSEVCREGALTPELPHRLCVVEVDGPVGQPANQPVTNRRGQRAGMLAQTLGGVLSEALVAPFLTRGAGDREAIGKPARRGERRERWQEKAPGEVTRGAEEDQPLEHEAHPYARPARSGSAASPALPARF